eukprot:gene29145-38209_t
MQGIGILATAAVTAIVAACFDAYYPSTPYPAFLPCGCAKWSTCSLDCQNLYYAQIKASCPPETDFVWRTVLAFGAFPALCTFYFRSHLPETPRFLSFVQGKVQETAASLAEATKGLDDELSRNLDGQAAKLLENSEALGYRRNLVLPGHPSALRICSRKQVGFLPPAKFMYAQEVGQIAKAQSLIALGSTIPGYWFTVFFVDYLGRVRIQFMGFALMTAFMIAMAGAYYTLLNPNTDNGDIYSPTGQTTAQPTNRNGWIAMYAFCFFFANFGPNSTTFIVPAELFPTKWKSTGHGISAALGKAGAIIGAFGFVYASSPARGEMTWDFPCDIYKKELMSNGACNVKANCPVGRMKPSDPHGSCDTCIKGALSGCYPYGIKVRGSLFVLAGINCLGFLFTFLIPETNNKSLEELNGEAETDEGDEEDRAARREGPSKAGETGIVELNEVDVKSY